MSEVDNAVGQTTKTASEVLIEKREALAHARERYATAKTMRDEIAMSDEMRTIDALNALLPELEREAADELEAVSVKRAQARIVAIKRAFGSVVNELDADEKRVVEKITELQDTIARLNDRYGKAAQLKAESEALSDRFGIAKPTLNANKDGGEQAVVPPCRRAFVAPLVALPDALRDHPDIRQPLEEDEHKLRTRRTYAEVRGTDAFKIISAAGLKPFPELTENQRQIVNSRQRQEEEQRRSFQQYAGLAPDIDRSWGK